MDLNFALSAGMLGSMEERPENPPWTPSERFMRLALDQAAQAAEAGEVPVGAIITQGDTLIAKAHNQVELLKDPTAHAEVIAITQAAAALGDWRLLDTVLYVTKEPCPMCAGAIVNARIPRVVWGMTDPRRGGATSLFNMFDNAALNHRPSFVTGFMEPDCREVMLGFFRARRQREDPDGSSQGP